MVTSAIAGFFIFAIVGSVGLGVASASSADELAASGAFGFGSVAHASIQPNHSEAAATPKSVSGASKNDSDVAIYEQASFARTSTRDITSGLKMIDDKERAEQERIAIDNVAVFDRVRNQKAMQGVDSPEGATMEYNLPAIDWSVGRVAFIAEWTERIDAYLEGSPLEGYGAVFAEAAWDAGIDPRWSPAISNTESGKGQVCFRAHNAWGWGSSDWEDWDTAIRSHVAGLAVGYGYSLTPEAAAVYCPPTPSAWYNTTFSQMALM